MSRLVRVNNKTPDDVEIDMVPIMNMFLVLIPFLLMSASFLHIKAINTSVPVLGESDEKESADRNAKVMVIVRILEKGIQLSAISETVDQQSLDKLETKINKIDSMAYPLQQMTLSLARIKQTYPASDTVLIIPDDKIVYETIIAIMDAARRSSEDKLFTNVVLSGKAS